MYSWYLLYTKPKKEAQAEEGLRDQNYEVFRPKIRFHKIRNQSQITITESLFLRYFFIKLDEENCNWIGVRSTRGVSNFVSFGQYPAKVPEKMIHELKSLVGENDVIDKTLSNETVFKKGDIVEINDGGFKGYRASVFSQSSEERVIVMLDMLGRNVPVSVPIGYLAS